MATNLANDSARTRRRRRLLLLASGARVPHADPPAPPDEQVELTDRAARMQRALLHLSEKERTALLMREEGFKHHEIAATIGTETSTVGTLMARALRKLARSMDPDREEP